MSIGVYWKDIIAVTNAVIEDLLFLMVDQEISTGLKLSDRCTL